jgi:hypothetical protein
MYHKLNGNEHRPLIGLFVHQLNLPATSEQLTELKLLIPSTCLANNIMRPSLKIRIPSALTHGSLMSSPIFPDISHSGTVFVPKIVPYSEYRGFGSRSPHSHYNSGPSEIQQSSHNSDLNHPSPTIDNSYSFQRSSFCVNSNTHRPAMDSAFCASLSLNSENNQQSNSPVHGQNGSLKTEAATTSLDLINSTDSPPVSAPEPKYTPEKKALRERMMVIQEIIDTESAFSRDMDVVEELYKGSARACLAICQGDIKALFGNSDVIRKFSKDFHDILKHASANLYVMHGSPSGINNSDAGVAHSTHKTEPSSHVKHTENDPCTYVGEAFSSVMPVIEQVYGDYCTNYELAIRVLEKIQKIPGVACWLSECDICAEDLTNASNLGSLLIKPIQRVLKYPLLLGRLLECTPSTHNDHPALKTAFTEIQCVADRINTLKKRKDIINKVVSGMNNEPDIRHGISKGFSRRAQKLRQSVGLSDVVVDETYNRLFQNYNMHLIQIQTIARDVEKYTADIQAHADKLVEFALNFKKFADPDLPQHPDRESKWKEFENTMKHFGNKYLQEHVRYHRNFNVLCSITNWNRESE